MPFYNARFLPASCFPNGHMREHCSAQRNQITTIGRKKRQQVRVEHYTADGRTLVDLALYTIVTVHDEEPNLAFVGYSEPETKNHDLGDRLGLSGVEPFIGKMISEVSRRGLSDQEAERDSEFVERLTDNGQHQGLIVIAPHGGNIERHTDEQAKHVGDSSSLRVFLFGYARGSKKMAAPLTGGTSPQQTSALVISQAENGDRPRLCLRSRIPRLGGKFYLHRRQGSGWTQRANQDVHQTHARS
jgi:hypothetical protein